MPGRSALVLDRLDRGMEHLRVVGFHASAHLCGTIIPDLSKLARDVTHCCLSWNRAVQTLCNPGEGFLTEEWSYPTSLAAAAPYNIKPVSVAMDGEGMRSDDLRKVLEEWDEEARGMKRYVCLIWSVVPCTHFKMLIALT